jgi:hypothetical protein
LFAKPSLRQKKRALARSGVQRFTRGYPREFHELQVGKTTLIAIGLLTLLPACGAPANTDGANEAAASSEQQYQAAPELTGASFPQGRIELIGRAAPGAAVRLTSPGAPPQFATADAGGAWTLTVPATGAARLFGLSMSAGGRVVQAMGYLAVAPGVIARLRVGGGAEVLTPPGRKLAALALDYDSKGAATLSGLARPGESVGLRTDGVERGQAPTDQSGRFTLSLSEPLSAGAHDFELVSPSGSIRFSAQIAGPAPLTGTPYAAQRQGAGWRIDWMTPGGGEQTTLILDQSGGGA